MRYTLTCLLLAAISAIAAGCMQPLPPAPAENPGAKTDQPAKPAEKAVVENPSKAPEKSSATVSLDARFEKQLLAVGKDYASYRKIGETPGWASLWCDAPRRGEQLRDPILSASADEATHGRKMYFLWAKDETAYLKADDGGKVVQPVGQAIVKESYHPVESARPGFSEPRTTRNGKTYTLGEKFALFVMLKLDPATEGTDDGWVYATLTPDGKTVTSSGIIKSCAGCHQDCAADRMFGYKPPVKRAGGHE